MTHRCIICTHITPLPGVCPTCSPRSRSDLTADQEAEVALLADVFAQAARDDEARVQRLLADFPGDPQMERLVRGALRQ